MIQYLFFIVFKKFMIKINSVASCSWVDIILFYLHFAVTSRYLAASSVGVTNLISAADGSTGSITAQQQRPVGRERRVGLLRPSELAAVTKSTRGRHQERGQRSVMQ